MSDTRQLEIEALIEALDEEPIDDADGTEAVKRLGVNVKAWALDVRQRIAKADKVDRSRQFDEARRVFREEATRYEGRRTEPTRSIAEQRAVLQQLMTRVPSNSSATVAVHFHKFEEATPEELAEMIKALRHLLSEDE